MLLAYRHFLAKFKMAGEAQIVDRFMTHFAERFCTCCPDVFKFSGANRHQLYPNVSVRLDLTACSGARAETCYMLAFATLMLNTDAHNPQVRDKMSKTAFIANNRYSIALLPSASRQALTLALFSLLRLYRKLTVQEEIPSAFLEELYDKIVKNEIKMEVDGVMFGSAEKKVRKFSSLPLCPGSALIH
jgi:brefeldin A-inhibited guanine nucleotide-exchange protein